MRWVLEGRLKLIRWKYPCMFCYIDTNYAFSRPAFKISRALQVTYEDRNKFEARLMQKLAQPPLNIIDERNVRIIQVKQPQELDSPGHVIKGTTIWTTLQSIYSKYTVHQLSCMFLPAGIPRLIRKWAMCVSYNNAEKEKHTAFLKTSEALFRSGVELADLW